jgi:hypothetical protein
VNVPRYWDEYCVNDYLKDVLRLGIINASDRVGPDLASYISRKFRGELPASLVRNDEAFAVWFLLDAVRPVRHRMPLVPAITDAMLSRSCRAASARTGQEVTGDDRTHRVWRRT